MFLVDIIFMVSRISNLVVLYVVNVYTFYRCSVEPLVVFLVKNIKQLFWSKEDK